MRFALLSLACGSPVALRLPVDPAGGQSNCETAAPAWVIYFGDACGRWSERSERYHQGRAGPHLSATPAAARRVCAEGMWRMR